GVNLHAVFSKPGDRATRVESPGKRYTETGAGRRKGAVDAAHRDARLPWARPSIENCAEARACRLRRRSDRDHLGRRFEQRLFTPALAHATVTLVDYFDRNLDRNRGRLVGAKAEVDTGEAGHHPGDVRPDERIVERTIAELEGVVRV